MHFNEIGQTDGHELGDGLDDLGAGSMYRRDIRTVTAEWMRPLLIKPTSLT